MSDLPELAVVRREPLQGGALSEVARLHLEGGGTVIAKTGPLVATEAGMLRALARAGAPAPRVIAQAGETLLLDDLGRDDGPGAAGADLGQVLRRLHGTTGDAFGWPQDYAFGPVPIRNAMRKNWPGFWAEQRLLPFCPDLPPDLARRIEALAARLPELLPAAPRPALLHGDLWTGNVMAQGACVTGLIDPACYYGDPEVDLAMLDLFGAPVPGVRHSYGPLPSGASERRPIYQLWPALVHLRLFGDRYRPLVRDLLGAAGFTAAQSAPI